MNANLGFVSTPSFQSSSSCPCSRGCHALPPRPGSGVPTGAAPLGGVFQLQRGRAQLFRPRKSPPGNPVDRRLRQGSLSYPPTKVGPGFFMKVLN